MLLGITARISLPLYVKSGSKIMETLEKLQKRFCDAFLEKM